MTYPTYEQVKGAWTAYCMADGIDAQEWMRAALIAAEQAAWLPIESAPKDGSRVMLYRKGHIVFGCWNDDRYARKPCPYWSHDNERAFGTSDARKVAPTLWRAPPLPTVPGPQP